MENKLELFKQLVAIFKTHGYQLFMVGGTVRDYLLKLPLTDMDVVTDATPEEMKQFLPDASYTFAKFGSVSYKIDGVKFDITTLREENVYIDSRHPQQIIFVKDLTIDVKRRDFTINALYMDEDLKVFDYVDGVKDLNNHLIRMIGNPDIRINEDPLRIIRALRFSLDFDFDIEKSLSESIKKNFHLLANLNIEKVKQDIKKITCTDRKRIETKFEEYNIKHYLDVVE